MSERAVSLVTVACRDKFPVVEAPLRSLPRQALDKLRGRFGPDPHLDQWSGSIYNGNENWTVKKLALGIVGERLKTPELYSVPVDIPPLSNAEITVSVNWPSWERYTWSIVSATGFQ